MIKEHLYYFQNVRAYKCLIKHTEFKSEDRDLAKSDLTEEELTQYSFNYQKNIGGDPAINNRA